jgi:hypothetical protein
LTQYTVIGFYTDSGLRCIEHVQAASWLAAIRTVADAAADQSISIAAVIAGTHTDLMECGAYLEDTSEY